MLLFQRFSISVPSLSGSRTIFSVRYGWGFFLSSFLVFKLCGLCAPFLCYITNSCVIVVISSLACTLAISLHQLINFGYTDIQLVINFEFMVLSTSCLVLSYLFFTQRIYHNCQLVLLFHACSSVGPSNSVCLDKDMLCTVKCILFAHFYLIVTAWAL